MKEDQKKYIELLDKFLKEGLSDAELDDLKNASEQNAELKKALALHLEAKANIRISGEADLKKKLLNELEQKSKTKPKSKSLSWLWTAAAAVFFLITFRYFGSQFNPTESIAQYIENPPSVSLRNGQESPFQQKWQTGLDAYYSESYKAADEIFQSILLSEDGQAHSGKLLMFIGLSKSAQGAVKEAINTFDKVPKANPLWEQATWYAALCAVESDDPNQAIERLEAISENNNHYKKDEAQNLLDKLK